MVLILFCLFSVLCIVPLARNFNFLSSFNLMLGTFYLYYSVAMAGYLGGNYTLLYAGDQVVVRYREPEVIFELLLVNLFLAGMLLAKVIIKDKLTRADSSDIQPAPPSYKHVLTAAYVTMACGIVMYALFIRFTYGSISNMLHIDRYALYQKKKGMGTLLIGLYIFYVGMLIRLFYYFLYRRTVAQKMPWPAMVLTLCMLFLQYRNGDRSNIVFFLLPLVLLLLSRKPRFNFYLVLCLPVILVIFQLLSVQRRLKLANDDEKLISFIVNHPQQLSFFQNGEFIAPSLVDRKVCENINLVDTRFGGTYVDVLRSLPPQWLIHKRPQLPAEWYADTFFPEEYAIGQGFGFSIIAESILNGYYTGPLIYGFLLGLLLLYLDKRVKRTRSFYLFAGYCIFQYYVFLTTRSGVAGLIKPGISVLLISAICVYFASRIYPLKDSEAK